MSSSDISRRVEAQFRKKLAEDPRNISVRLEFARFLIGQGRTEEAKEHIEKTIRQDPTNTEVIFAIARYSSEPFSFTFDNVPSFKSILKAAIKKNPDSAEPYRYYAEILMDEGNYERALKFLLKALKLSKDPALEQDFFHCLARLAKETEDTATALELVKMILETGHDNPYRLRGISAFMRELNRWEEALRYQWKAFQLDPNRKDLYLYVDLLEETGSYEEAVRLLAENESLFRKDPEGYILLGFNYEMLDKWDEASDAYQKALKVSPGHPKALVRLAAVMRKKRFPPEKVEECYKKAIESDPDDPDVRLDYCDFLLARGRRDEAILLYRKIMEKGGRDLRELLPFYQSLLEAGDREGAVISLILAIRREKYLRFDPDDIAAAARLLILAGEEEFGERLLKEIVYESEQESFFAYEYLGDFYYEKGRPAEAFGEYLLALLMDPSDTTMWLKLVGTLFDARENEEALKRMFLFARDEAESRSKRNFSKELLKAVADLVPQVKKRDLAAFATFREAAWTLGHPSLLAAYGKIAAEFGGEEEAREAFRRAFKAAPQDAALVREYVGFLFSYGKYEEALPILERAMKENPDEPSIRNDYALALYETGARRQAEEIFAELAGKHPLEATYVYNHAWLLFESGDSDGARRVLAEFHEKGPFDVENTFFYAQLLADEKDPASRKRAEDLLRKVLSARPNHVSALLLLAWMEMEEGRFASAEHYLRKARRADPRDPRPFLSTADLFLATMQFYKAAKAIKEASSRLSGAEDEKARMDLLLAKARFLQATGEYEASLPMLKKLFIASPQEYGFHLACTLMHLGRTEEAKKVASGLLERPVTRKDRLARSWYRFLCGETFRAVEELLEGMGEKPEITDFRNMAIYLLELNEPQEAERALGVFLENVMQPLDVHFFIRDLESYAARFPDTLRKRFLLRASVKLQSLLKKIHRRSDKG